MESSGTLDKQLEEQLEATRAKSVEIRTRKVDLKQIEELGARLEERLILDNRYTEHSTVSRKTITVWFGTICLITRFFSRQNKNDEMARH